ncbi:hypothetical protein MBLNU13_g10192t1 [Cladosporium sp. NU13]
MRLDAGKDRRSPCGTECRYVKLAQAQRQRQFGEDEEGLESAGKKGREQGEESVFFAVQRSGQTEGIGNVACSERRRQQQQQREVRKGNGALDWVAVVASQRIGPPYGLDFRSRMFARNAAKLCAYLVGAGRPPTSAKKAQ